MAHTFLTTVITFLVTFSVSFAWNCTDEEGFYECKSGKCIPNPWVCDGARDCPDGDDEIHVKCGSGERKCTGLHFECVDPHSGQTKCARPEWRCDGFIDCAKGIDEENCEKPVPQLAPLYGQPTPNNRGRITIQSASSIPPDVGTSENGTTCDDSMFTCNDGACIDRDKVCDDNKDCKDGSDESEQRCSKPPIRPFIQPGVPTALSMTTPIVGSSNVKTVPNHSLPTNTTTRHPLTSVLHITTPMVPNLPPTIETITKTARIHVVSPNHNEESHDETPKTVAETAKPIERFIVTSKTEETATDNVKMKPQRFAIMGNSNAVTAKPLRNPVYGTPIVPVRNFQVLFPLHVEMKGSSKGVSKSSLPPKQESNHNL